jgi:fucose 4-O-acetylase-like acetyltransferase
MWKGLRVVLGVLAGLLGVPLLIGGLFVFIMAGYVIDPTIAGGGQTEGMAAIAFVAASVGALSCLAAWSLVRSAPKGSKLLLWLAGPPLAFLGIWGIVFGLNLLSAIYHDDTGCILCIAMGTTLILVDLGLWSYAGWLLCRDNEK